MLGVLRRTKAALLSAGNKVRRAATLVLPYSPMRGGESWLDRQYSKGSWEYLRGVGELPRFSLVVGYAHHMKPNGKLAEVGAGDGILHERLDRSKYSSYLGMDISAVAIERLNDRRDAHNSFAVGDATVFTPPDRYDAVIFNEVLEYFDAPADVVRRWVGFLAPGGVVIVSMFSGIDTARSVKIWRALSRDFTTVAQSEVKNERGMRWRVKVLSPKAASG
jgi:2-polyprenyl-3-methyl-5-hydroxy-6-metoxy-1,4-benzoquinol methylase